MDFKALCGYRYLMPVISTKTWLIMKFTGIFLLAACLQVSAKGYSQITLSEHNVPLTKVFREIQKQSGYDFLCSYELLQKAGNVTVDLKNVSLQEAVEACLKGKPLTYQIVNKTVIVQKRSEHNPKDTSPPPINIKGKVTNEKGEPVIVTVMVKESGNATTTNEQGEFELKGVDENGILVIRGISIETREVSIAGKPDLDIVVKTSIAEIEAVTINAGYYRVKDREGTGSIGRVDGKTIEKQPVSNPLAALVGRIPGVRIGQLSGIPGIRTVMQIRGKNSIEQGNNPYFLVDGVPFGNQADGDFSPFNSINPSDIESIEVLKDADATAIYGSRGANGVVLITTKKGKAGKTNLDVNIYTGAGKTTRTPDLLNTEQYLTMRREAFANDGVTPSITNAPDLLLWDNNRYTDWKKLVIGGTANTTDAQVTLSGGSANTQFRIGAGYHHETSVLPTDKAYRRSSVNVHLSHSSADKKFSVIFQGFYSNDKNGLLGSSLIGSILLPPNAPSPYDSTGKLNWSEGGAFYNNPLAVFLQTNTVTSDNLNSSAVLRYLVIDGLHLKLNLGYNHVRRDNVNITPKASLSPNVSTPSSSRFSYSTSKTWTIEPQIEYEKAWGKHKISLLVGTSWQQDLDDAHSISAGNFSNEELLGSPGAAGSSDVSSSYNQYRYQAIFGRINYNYDTRYILNLTGRRDGSSRFGPGKQYGLFGAAGAAWLFSKEKIFKEIHWLSYGKLRGSYGITGNDQIGNYNYLDLWRPVIYPYQDVTGLLPQRFFNPDYHWEVNRKLEIALEIGLFQDRLQFTTNFYQNRSSNQLVSYLLPIQTGFSSITQNFPALVQNKGWEFMIATKNIRKRQFSWSTSFNVTVDRNKLLEFPGLATSSYARMYEIDRTLSIKKLLPYVTVDPTTGIYQFAGTSIPDDQTNLVDVTPKFDGGLNNELTYKSFQLSFFFHFSKQIGESYAGSGDAPGTMRNQPVYVLNRWQKPGDITDIQRYTTTGTAFTAYSNYVSNSDGIYTDASFIRLKNVSLSYHLPAKIVRLFNLQQARVYLQGQNLIVITGYKGADPEARSLAYLPPVKFYTAGIQLNF